jgi:hypothetical protein
LKPEPWTRRPALAGPFLSLTSDGPIVGFSVRRQATRLS